MKKILILIGLIGLAVGILWIGQGLGYINWPPSSFMISQKPWAYYGGCVAFIGLLFIWIGRKF